ncbi:MAG: hypothetical protein UH542_00905 [Bacteroidales bacterium]|nr:hypothetical protein [Bacteroidales bacterium]
MTLDYVQSPLEQQNLRDKGKLIDTFQLPFEDAQKVLKEIEKSQKTVKEIDAWLKKIGFYDRYGESKYRYGIIFKDVIKYNTPRNLSEFRNKSGDAILTAPQSFVYTID